MMWTIVSYQCLVVLVSAHFCSTLSEGAVFPCSKNDTQFNNQTVWASMGRIVSFTFCAESSVRVYERISISHPNHKDGWYPQPAGAEETLDVRVVIHHRMAKVTIKVTELQPADFNETFIVTLFAADENGTRINATSTFFFVFEETDNDTTIPATPNTPVTTDVGNSTTGCADQSVLRPRHFCHVVDDICLTVIIGIKNETPRAQCATHNLSHVPDFKSIDILKPCLTSLLQLPPVPIVRLGETRYIDTRNWTDVDQQLPYCVPCLFGKQQLAAPVITWFTLQQWDDQRETILWQRNLLDHNNSSVTIPTTNNTLNVTCRANGYPKPEVTILRDNEKLVMSPDGISLQLNHAFSGELICHATNVHKLGSTHVRVLVSTRGPPQCPTDINVTNYGHDYVILSWKPGLDGGSRQYFYVYYSKDNITWYTHGSKTENTINDVSGLSSNTSYYLRVASWNQHRTTVDANTCTRTVFVTTKSLINHVGLCEVPERSDTLVLIVGGCFLLVGMLFLSALICWWRKVNRQHGRRDLVQGQVEIPMVATQAGPSTTPGEYETIGDLN